MITVPKEPELTPEQLAWEAAEDDHMQQVDEVNAVAASSKVGSWWLIQKWDAFGREQVHLSLAERALTARPYEAKAAELSPRIDAYEVLKAQLLTRLDRAASRYEHAVCTLIVLTRRDRSAWYRYVIGLVVLVLGDTAGILGAAVSLGEYPIVALGQALAVGFAGVASGHLGSDVKDLRLARQRQRDPDSLSSDEERYRHLFAGVEAGVSIIKLVGCLSLTIVVVIAGGIFTLRMSVEGAASGTAFAAMAGATALGSFLSSYAYADDVADLLDSLGRQYSKALSEYRCLVDNPAFGMKAEAVALAASVREEVTHRGLAAQEHMTALGKLALSRNPGVAGHGEPPQIKPSNTGRRLRGDRK